MQNEVSNEQLQQTIKQQEESIKRFQKMVSEERYLQVREVAVMQLNDFQTLQSRQSYLMDTIAQQKAQIAELSAKLRQFQSRINPDKLQSQKKETVKRIISHLAESEHQFYLQ